MYIAIFEFVNNSSCTVLDIKLRMEEDGDLHTDDHHLYSFKFIHRRLKIDAKCCHRLAITHNKNETFFMFVISNNKSFISQTLKVTGLLGEEFDSFSPLKFKTILMTTPQKSSSVRALQSYLNEKSLIHVRETATISKFSALIFETNFSTITPEISPQARNNSPFQNQIQLIIRIKTSAHANPRFKSWKFSTSILHVLTCSSY